MKWLYVILFLVLLHPLWADTIILKNGNRLEGIVKKQGDHVHITLPYGTLVIPRDQIKSIILGMTALDQYNQKIFLLDPKDVDARYDLAMWCKENGLYTQFKKELEMVLIISPDHEKARQALGYERHQGRWVTQDEAMAIQGYIQHKGQWMHPNKYYAIVVEEFKKELEEERYARKVLQQKLEENLAQQMAQFQERLQERLLAIEKDIIKMNAQLDQLAREVSRPRYIYVKKD
jgi:hypothetical protein